jgi:hypothetical protein
MGDYDVDMDCDMDDAVAFSQEDWTNGETTEDMEWDTAVLEAALHELDHLRHGHGAHGVSSSSLDRGLLDTNDGGLTHADGGDHVHGPRRRVRIRRAEDGDRRAGHQRAHPRGRRVAR